MCKAYGFADENPFPTHKYLLPVILGLCPKLGPGTRVLDVGCGNGAMAGEFLRLGCSVVGIDPSEKGIQIARKTFPGARFEVLSADDHFLQSLNCEAFDLVISTEVVEHVYDPLTFMRRCFEATRANGRFICSTPYHGYLKNLAISIAGKWDWHFSPLFVGGHIKFWSASTLTTLMREAGFTGLQFKGAGRLPFFWMSMVVAGDKPVP